MDPSSACIPWRILSSTATARSAKSSVRTWISPHNTLQGEQLESAVVALLESEQRFRDYAETASDWLWETGPDHRVTHLSEQTSAAGILASGMIGLYRWEIGSDVEFGARKMAAASRDARRASSVSRSGVSHREPGRVCRSTSGPAASRFLTRAADFSVIAASAPISPRRSAQIRPNRRCGRRRRNSPMSPASRRWAN